MVYSWKIPGFLKISSRALENSSKIQFGINSLNLSILVVALKNYFFGSFLFSKKMQLVNEKAH